MSRLLHALHRSAARRGPTRRPAPRPVRGSRRPRTGHLAPLPLVLALVASFILVPGSTGAATASPSLGGATARGTNANGEGYLLDSLASLADVTSISVTMAAGTDDIAVFAADKGATVVPPDHEVTPPWNLIFTRTYDESGVAHPVAAYTFPAHRTRYLLVLARRFDNTGGPIPVKMTVTGSAGPPTPPAMDGKPATPRATGTASATATKPTATSATVMSTATKPMPTSTATTVPPTAVPASTATTTGATNGTPAADCHDLGDGAVDQHGVSVDRWAPGLRKACGFLGYENGDNPMPPGTPFDAPRPFRFDYTYDHNEAVFGFKVFYYKGAANHCGDMREILHQGGGTAGFDTEFHTYQFAYAQCDNEAASTMRIVDIGGQADLGCLISRTQFNQTGEACPPGSASAGGQGERITADTQTCTAATHGQDGCVTSWYPTLNTDSPRNGTFGVDTTLVVYNPITALDQANHLNRVPTGEDGTVRGLSLMLIYNLKSTVSERWDAIWDLSRHKQVVVAAGTPGSWPMRVDAGFAWPDAHPGETARCDDSHACYGDGTLGLATQRHAAPAGTTTGVASSN